MADAVFTQAGELLQPSELARGPWQGDAQHGGAPSALIARALERSGQLEGMTPARITVEYLRPLLLDPLAVEVELLRPGRRVRLLRVGITQNERQVCAATALLIRRSEARVAPATDSEPLPPAAATGTRPPRWSDQPTFMSDAVEQRFVAGSFERPGPATVWMRLQVPVVADENATPLQRVMALADFGNGASAMLDWNNYVFINPDLTVYIERLALGEWICLDASTRMDGHGTGVAESVLYDVRGRIGRGLQALYVDRAG